VRGSDPTVHAVRKRGVMTERRAAVALAAGDRA
jgi:hypothetical protein